VAGTFPVRAMDATVTGSLSVASTLAVETFAAGRHQRCLVHMLSKHQTLSVRYRGGVTFGLGFDSAPIVRERPQRVK
jgi:hypothetical protein